MSLKSVECTRNFTSLTRTEARCDLVECVVVQEHFQKQCQTCDNKSFKLDVLCNTKPARNFLDYFRSYSTFVGDLVDIVRLLRSLA